MTVRDYLKRQGWGRKIVTDPTPRGEAEHQSGAAELLTSNDPNLPLSGEGVALASERNELPMENPEPLKQRIHRQGNYHTHPMVRLVRALYQRTPWCGPKNDEERVMLDERKRRQAQEAVLREEAKICRERMVNALNRLGVCYRYPKSQKDFLNSGVQSVRFDRIILTPDALYFHVDSMRLPRGVSIIHLTTPELVTDLSVSVGRRISAKYTEKIGIWYIVERAAGAMGIPSHVKLTDMWMSFPKSADGLSLPLGMAANNRLVYKSLGNMYSMLVGGTIGSGKSNILNVILCTLIRRNSPSRLKLLLVDLKGGLEFSFYEGIPHLLKLDLTDKSGDPVAPGGIAYERDHVPYVLAWLHAEGERRIRVIREAGYKDIGRYNQHNRRNHLAHLVLVIDEWADIKLDHETGTRSENLLTNIAQRFRAVGIHVILCTQVPKSEILSTRIKGVLPAKCAFSCPTNQGSMAILDNGHAKSLEPAGRMILQWVDELQIQTPFINDSLIHETVEGAKAGKFENIATDAHDVAQLEVMQWALDFENGYLSRDRLFSAFQARGISKAELSAWLAEWEGQEYMIGSSLYKVTPAAGTRARRLVAVEEEDNHACEQPQPEDHPQ